MYEDHGTQTRISDSEVLEARREWELAVAEGRPAEEVTPLWRHLQRLRRIQNRQFVEDYYRQRWL